MKILSLGAHAWRSFLADLDLYTLVIAGVLFAVLGAIGIADTKTLSSVILAGLTLLAFSQARSRHVANDRVPNQVGSVFLADFPEELYKRRAVEAKSYMFLGPSGYRTVGTGIRDFQAMLDRGATVRFLLADPEKDDVVKTISASGQSNQSPERIRERIAGTLSELSKLDSRKSGSLEIKLLPFPPPFGANAFSQAEPDGKVFVQQYIPSSNMESSPLYVVEARDTFWFKHFSEELERLWNAGRMAP